MRLSGQAWGSHRFLDDLGKPVIFLLLLVLSGRAIAEEEHQATAASLKDEVILQEGESPARLTAEEAVFGIWYVLGVTGAGFVLFVVLFYFLYPTEKRHLQTREDDDESPDDTVNGRHVM